MSAIGHNGALTFSSDNGWVAIARSIRSHPLVGIHLFAKPMDPSRGAVQPMAAFIDLIMECRYEDGFIQNGGRKMEVKRGQMVGAVSWLAARWNWTPMAVRIWLDKLEADMMISRFVPGASKSNKHVGRIATVISLCNYEQFQSFGENKQQTQQQTNSNQTTNEQQQYKDNKGTREQGNNISPSPLQGEGREDIHPPRDLDGRGDDAPEAAPRRRNPRMAHWLPQDKPDGSNGIDWRDGKLTVFNGTAAALAKEFPTLDLAAVCNKAAPRVANIKNPTHLQVLAAIRAQCQYELDYQAKAPPARAGGGSKDPFAGLDAKSRAKVEAARLAKQREGQ